MENYHFVIKISQRERGFSEREGFHRERGVSQRERGFSEREGFLRERGVSLEHGRVFAALRHHSRIKKNLTIQSTSWYFYS